MAEHVALGRAKELARGALERVAATGHAATAPARTLDVAVRSALAQLDVADLVDLPAAVDLLTSALGPQHVHVEVVRPPTQPNPRWDTVCELLAAPPPLPTATALTGVRVTDRLYADPTPFVRPTWEADVGIHARLSSSGPDTARILSLLVRLHGPETLVEVGTAYGVGAMYLAEAVRRRGTGHVHTLEVSQPQIDVASRVLAPYAAEVTTHHGPAQTLLADVVAETGPIDLLFHDGHHSGEAYVTDFATARDALRPGALVLFDDIRWHDPRFASAPADTYDGWRTLVDHPSVVAAAELDGQMGLLLVGMT